VTCGRSAVFTYSPGTPVCTTNTTDQDYMSVHILGVAFFPFSLFKSSKEEFEDTKGVIRISK
jgi:hypothetical protein